MMNQDWVVLKTSPLFPGFIVIMSCYRMSELNRLLAPGSWLNAIQSQALITLFDIRVAG